MLKMQLFYIRSHQPVPYLTEQDLEEFRLTVDLTAFDNKEVGNKKFELSLEQLRQLPYTEVTATLQCSGNRRSYFNDAKGGGGRTSGTSWYQGAISNATWGGVTLRDVLKHVGISSDDEALDELERQGLDHVRVSSLDDFHVSIGFDKAYNRKGDVLIALDMNGAPLPRDHGFPLRLIVPGYIGVRNCKWLSNTTLATEDSDSPYQRGLNYKILPHNVTNAKNVDLSKLPSMYEAAVFSGITNAQVVIPVTRQIQSESDRSTNNVVEVMFSR
jgi:sulfite oxidase